MNAGHNCFGSGNRANATIGRAIRMVLLNVGGGWPGDLDKATLGHPGKYTYRSEEHTSELQSLMRISYAVFCLKKKNKRSDDGERTGGGCPPPRFPGDEKGE